MAGIFINYRRDDSPGVAGRLFDYLALKYPRSGIFMDVDAMKPGMDFTEQLDSQVSQCRVVLAVIGPRWIDAKDKAGHRRLDSDRDYVRIELALALKRAIPVIPILVDGAAMPQEESLSDDLKPLARRHALELRHTRFNSDANAIVRALEGVVPRRRLPWPVIGASVVVAIGVSVMAVVWPTLSAKLHPSLPQPVAPSTRPPATTLPTVALPPAAAPVAPSTVLSQQAALPPPPSPPAPLTPTQPSSQSSPASSTPTVQLPPAAVPSAPLAAKPPFVPLSSAHERALQPRDSFKECNNCPEMVVVPAGSFIMGSPGTEVGRWDNESPQHKVTFPHQFAVGRFSVTFDEWDACVADGGCNGYSPSDQGWGRGRRPVINVSWNDVKTYLAWLSHKAGKAYRLLSEAEREYVARAGTTTPFWWGSSISTTQANYKGTETYGDDGVRGEFRNQSVPVDTFAPNPWGLYQMHGNVSEWTEDCRHDDYIDAPTDGSAWTAPNCNQHVRRGGSIGSPPRVLRAASRLFSRPADAEPFLGFRVARSLAP